MGDRIEIDRLQQLLVELQTQQAFQEQAISDLSRALARQQEDIFRLTREWQRVEERYASLQAQLPDGSPEEKPPHY